MKNKREEVEHKMNLACVKTYNDFCKKRGLTKKNRAREDAYITGFWHGVREVILVNKEVEESNV